MYQKKRFAAGAMALFISLALAAPASAHCSHGRTDAARAASIAVCTLDGCTTAGRHTHDGVLYCGSHHADGVCDGTCLTSTAHHHGGGHHRGHCR